VRALREAWAEENINIDFKVSLHCQYTT
jgi:hypothetical protein